jgi:prephenate dehydrogenase
MHVVGCGLIGGSAALGAARSGWTVTVEDHDEQAAEVIRSQLAAMTAEFRGDAGQEWGVEPGLVLVAVPPAEIAAVVSGVLKRTVHTMVTDVGSIKTQPLADVEALSSDLSRYVPGHPIAGGETPGAAAARSGLFEGRTWVLCPTPSNAGAIDAVRPLVEALGATPVLVSADVHDAALAVTSHLPQVLASALAAVVADAFADDSRLVPLAGTDGGNGGNGTDVAVDPSELSGPALLDMTRIAGSPAELWAAIAGANSGPLAAALRALLEILEPYADQLFEAGSAAQATGDLVRRGARGRQLIAGKHGGRAPTAAPVPRLGAFGTDDGWTWLDVVVADEPGALAALFATAAELGVNIEDLHVDHAPHRSTGVVSLAVRSGDVERLRTALDT